MSLHDCRDCGHQVSSTARRCPRCGCMYPMNSVGGALFWSLFGAAVTFGLLAWCISIGVEWGMK